MLTASPARRDAGADGDQGPGYGRLFGEIYDRVFPHDDRAAVTAGFLRALAPRPGAVFVEQGVGSGRIAVPLAARGGVVTGLDTSPDLLRAGRAAAAAAGVAVRYIEADIRRWTEPGLADVVYCVCATVSMLPTRADQAAAVAAAARTLRPGGALVVETHLPGHVRALHAGRAEAVFVVPVAGLDGGLRMTATLDAPTGRWSVRHRWTAAGADREASEESLLIEPDDLDSVAAAHGLVPEARHGSWDATAAADAGPSYIAVYRAPPDRSC
ncbi:class I SAM-dependent methyltransferase [Nakamurella deserti]|uniref:class I SAM-dependent methyltransferase n=1 Tax=Nakamurella deserti TaxID=2164074 RepID=UPI0013005288|nr:methyltransferase domain-containing protein [Nakamurella deserti]